MKITKLKLCFTLIFLATFTFFVGLYHNKSGHMFEDELESSSILKVSIDHQRNHSFCVFRRLSPEEAAEENLILNSIAWPEAPPLLPPRTIKDTSDPAHSSFTVLPKEGGGRWLVGDRLEVLIKMSDYYGRPKKYGGDVLFSRLHSRALGAGVAGEVLDHLNGSYSVVFPLLWEGSAQVEVTLLHPSEAVDVLHKLNIVHPDLVTYTGVFQSGSVQETTACNVCLRPSKLPLCDYTDVRTGEPWFCHKPKTLSCDHRTTHLIGPVKEKAFQNKLLFQSKSHVLGGSDHRGEQVLFTFNVTSDTLDCVSCFRKVNLKVLIGASGPGEVTVLPRKEDEPEVKQSSVVPGAVGYYYRGVWQSLIGAPVRQFNTSSAMTQCLSNKVVHMYGDSTIRQWFEHLKRVLPGLREFNLHNPVRSGPFLTLDYDNNIMVTFRCHGPPIRFGVSTSEMRYIANELDGVPGGPNTVIIIGIWSHFASFPIEIYTRRLLSIRKAVVRLLTRAPDTVIIFRTANLKSLALFEVLATSDWYSMQRDKVLRAVFRGINIHLVDAWGMTVSHWLPHDVHSGPAIIENMINVVLSYIC